MTFQNFPPSFGALSRVYLETEMERGQGSLPLDTISCVHWSLSYSILSVFSSCRRFSFGLKVCSDPDNSAPNL